MVPSDWRIRMTSFPVVGANNVIKYTMTPRRQTTADTCMALGPTRGSKQTSRAQPCEFASQSLRSLDRTPEAVP